ncbi:hypothetical protein EB796_015434 [Bugula neritina]|uniref:Uncharacterized protein n=1 Tax=Bugula neritina TaxID=10212 RepID=A0A7J7JJ09_BUGNE|nr:hypothetical protein EB796_015434 [Bugula neritina]
MPPALLQCNENVVKWCPMFKVDEKNFYDSTSNRLSFLSKESNTSFNCKKQNYQMRDRLDIINDLYTITESTIQKTVLKRLQAFF